MTIHVAPPFAFEVMDFGLSDYEAIWTLQKDRVQQRLRDEIPDTLMLGEHPPVITLGRGSHAENLLNPDIPVISIERGGDVTYHGPGQLIAYPIFKLPPERRDLHRYLRNLEECVLQTVAQFGVHGTRNPGWTGVWVANDTGEPVNKLASIGVAVKQWVTYHGIGLNVSTDLSHFAQINPCGLNSTIMTSLEALQGEPVSMSEVKDSLCESMQAVFFSESRP